MRNKTAVEIMETLLKYKEKSTCNKRKVAAALYFPGEIYYIASYNGDHLNPCTDKGQDYCTREDGPFLKEFLTCNSFCAEGYIIIDALKDEKELKDSTLITTDFPCERCTELIIGNKIPRLIFGQYKRGSYPWKGEGLRTYKLSAHGIDLFHLFQALDMREDKPKQEFVIERVNFTTSWSIFERGMKVGSTEYWMKTMDPDVRRGRLEFIRAVEEQDID